jgi:hypothetical protein
MMLDEIEWFEAEIRRERAVGMKKFLYELRAMLALQVLRLAVHLFPEPERAELARAIHPVSKVWKERTAAELKARGVEVR